MPTWHPVENKERFECRMLLCNREQKVKMHYVLSDQRFRFISSDQKPTTFNNQNESDDQLLVLLPVTPNNRMPPVKHWIQPLRFHCGLLAYRALSSKDDGSKDNLNHKLCHTHTCSHSHTHRHLLQAKTNIHAGLINKAGASIHFEIPRKYFCTTDWLTDYFLLHKLEPFFVCSDVVFETF